MHSQFGPFWTPTPSTSCCLTPESEPWLETPPWLRSVPHLTILPSIPGPWVSSALFQEGSSPSSLTLASMSPDQSFSGFLRSSCDVILQHLPLLYVYSVICVIISLISISAKWRHRSAVSAFAHLYIPKTWNSAWCITCTQSYLLSKRIYTQEAGIRLARLHFPHAKATWTSFQSTSYRSHHFCFLRVFMILK